MPQTGNQFYLKGTVASAFEDALQLETCKKNQILPITSKTIFSPGRVAQSVEASACTPKG